MLTADQIEALGNKAQQLIAPVTEFLIEDIARRIAEAGQFTSTSAYQTWRLQQLGISQRQLKKELRKRLKVSHRELRRLIEKAGETGYSYDIRKHPYVQAVPFRSNEALQQIVSAAAQLADSELDNITQTMGAVMPNGKAVGLTDRLAISPLRRFRRGRRIMPPPSGRLPGIWQKMGLSQSTMNPAFIPPWKPLSGVALWAAWD